MRGFPTYSRVLNLHISYESLSMQEHDFPSNKILNMQVHEFLFEQNSIMQEHEIHPYDAFMHFFVSTLNEGDITFKLIKLCINLENCMHDFVKILPQPPCKTDRIPNFSYIKDF